jgi:hypothetical protein
MTKTRYTKELLAPIVAQHVSIADVLRTLGLQQAGGTHRMISRWIRYWGLDTSHFTGARWARGETKHTHVALRSAAEKLTLPDELVFCENSSYSNSKGLRQRLLARGRKYACAVCGLSEWRGAAITLHLDHINGVNNDHREDNLRFLCPNCHQQTGTWGNSRGRSPKAGGT